MTLELIQSSLTSGCHVVKFWTLVAGTVSQTLLTINSSINFLMYPAISKDFRSVFKDYFKEKLLSVGRICTFRRNANNTETHDAESQNCDTCPTPILTNHPDSSAQFQEELNNASIILEEMPYQQKASVSCELEGSDRKSTIFSSSILSIGCSRCKMECHKSCSSDSPQDTVSFTGEETMAIRMHEEGNSENITVYSNKQQVPDNGNQTSMGKITIRNYYGPDPCRRVPSINDRQGALYSIIPCINSF